MTERQLANTLLLVVVSALALAGALTFSGQNSIWDDVRLELVKYLLQLLVVILIGGVIAALFKMFEHSRNEKLREGEKARDAAEKKEDEIKRQAQLRATIHEEYLRKIGAIYREVKSSRRLLRSEGLTSKHGPPSNLTERQIETYLREMKRIDASQLELEGLAMESRKLPIFMGVSDLTQNLYAMEDYLRAILSEYEQFAPQLGSENPPSFVDLERLDEFTGTTKRKFKGGRFLINYWGPYEKIISKISTAISKDTTEFETQETNETATTQTSS